MYWTPKLDKELMELYLIEGLSYNSISQVMGVSQWAVGRRARALQLSGHRGDNRVYYQRMGELENPPEPHFTPVRIELPDRNPPKVSSTEQTSLHWGDVHFPFHDQAAVDILYEITDELKPDWLVCHGDILDFWQISHHRPPLEKKLTPDQIDIQKTFEMGAQHLAKMTELANPARKVLLWGNHEDRFDRILTKIQTDNKLGALLHIPKIREVLDIDYIMGLQESGWETHKYLEGDQFVIHDRLLPIHGYKSTIWAARSHLQSYGTNVMFGHTHRIQVFTKSDLNGTVAGFNIGCLCDLRPHWRSRPDWHHGFAVVSWKKIDGEWIFNVEQVRIHDGRAVFRDQVYTGGQ